MHRPLALCLAALATALPAPGSAAAQQSFRGEYTVSFLGLPIARAAFQSRYDGATYRIDGSVASAGLAQIFDDTRGTIVASGRLARSGLQPRTFRADYTSGKKASLVDIRFAYGTVASTRVVPPPKKRGKDWVALDTGDLKSALDPIAATVVRAQSLDEVCGRTVAMYDGEMRADLKLIFVRKDKISVEGYEGPTVTCRMGFEPVSGYRQGKRALDYLKKRSRIMVTFAPLGQTGVYAPIHATVGTEIGTITVRARRFETTN
ncbi:hypothetical protein ASD64_01755 [Mesorhizobium sp. Root157]|uniref:DUF3108 domain-containing protein n=1 Tax=Mesorhizobium sp. Root157 TaxID=1736477 RepID=UPI0006FE53BA|nr:DUF3108 domain-containing protein [Mesorhizobium sp. Root157]KRA00321.1 hypothetical protein ASD64_01755 [Mesorhizobium sp. Root157]